MTALILGSGCMTVEPEKPQDKKKPQANRRDRSRQMDHKAAVWVMDNFEKANKWASQAWAAKGTLVTIESGNNKALEIKYNITPDKDKCVVGRFFSADISGRLALTMDVLNKDGPDVKVALGLVSTETGYRESPALAVKSGKKETLKFHLKKKYYKQKADNFKEHKSPAGNLAKLSQVYILIYSEGKGSIVLDNVTLFN